MNTSPTTMTSQQGVALLTVVILTLALVATMGTIFYRHQLDVSRVSGMLRTEQAQLLAYSVENWSKQLLSSDYDDREIDHLQENWAQAVPALPVEGGFVRGCLIDMQGRFNINTFGFYDDARWDSEHQSGASGLADYWLGLQSYLELPADNAQVVSIIDWLDEDEQPFNQWGAEQNFYDSSRVRTMVPNLPLTDVYELSVVKGFDYSAVKLLEPFVSALPTDTTVNVNTAPVEVLVALGGSDAQRFSEFVMENRPFQSYADFSDQLALSWAIPPDQVAAQWGTSTVGVNSDYFVLYVQVSLGEIELEVSSLLDRYGRDDPVVIRRALSTVPAIDRSSLSEEEFSLLQSPCFKPEES